MIFVMLGTNPYPFDRLLDAISTYSREANEKVVAQIGNTMPRDNIECYRYLSHSDVLKYIASADVVVCQGGYGSINDSISLGAKTVVVPRMKGYGECADNQVELVEAFASQGLIVPVCDIAELPDAIAKAKVMRMNKRTSSKMPEHIAKTIQEMIEQAQR